MDGRREIRVPAVLPVTLQHGGGITRNVSTSGVFFETDQLLTPGAAINFFLEFEKARGGPLRLKCEARIVRVEQQVGKIGVAATITSSQFKTMNQKTASSG